MNRRRFLKLLGAIPPLALGLRWPTAEPKPNPVREGYVHHACVYNRALTADEVTIRYNAELDDGPQTIYVWDHGNDANDGLSIAKAKRTITNAISSTGTNDMIHVLPGVYHEENEQLHPRRRFYMTHSILHLGPDGTLRVDSGSFFTNNYISRE